jgi:gliding motility-associated-like protein
MSPYSTIWSDEITTVNRQDIPDGTYTVAVLDNNGCSTMEEIVVGYSGTGGCLEIPTIITPNGDGYNDTWIIRNIDLFPDAEVSVFNRWGEQVFHTKNLLANPWDGTSGGKLLPTDSYHYILRLNDGSKPRSGVISIIR